MTRLNVKSGSNTDVVLHQPASVNGDPVVSTYHTPLSPIGPEKARVLLAHTATVAPADVRVDGKVVFTNIANGEYADADVPAGAHRVALLPTGTTTTRSSDRSRSPCSHAQRRWSTPSAVRATAPWTPSSTRCRCAPTGPPCPGRSTPGRQVGPPRAQVAPFGDDRAPQVARASADRAGPQLPWFASGSPGCCSSGWGCGDDGTRTPLPPGVHRRRSRDAVDMSTFPRPRRTDRLPRARCRCTCSSDGRRLRPGSAIQAPPRRGPRRRHSVVVEARPAERAGAVRPEQPRSVRLPDGVVVPIRAVSTRSDGGLDVPHDIRTAGWWRGGSRLGDPWGSTLVAAHVDSPTQGLGPVRRPARRTSATSGSCSPRPPCVRRSGRRRCAWSPRVRSPGNAWLSSPSGARRLVLVTCAPPYVPARGGYQNLAVVTAIPVSAPTPGGRLMTPPR